MNLLSFIATAGLGLGAILLPINDPTEVISDGLTLPVSQKSIDTIIYYEVGGRSLYEKKYTKPTVPAWQDTSSGVTVAFGVDVGHMTKDQISKALKNAATDEEIKLLQSVSGMKGANAYYNGLPKVKYNVNFTYEEAMKVFKQDTLPRFTKQTANAFALTSDRLHPDCNGALTCMVFNRGSSIDNSDRRKEMRWMKYNISVGREDRVPSDMRESKRIWDYNKLKGLHLRMDSQADLFQLGLDKRKKYPNDY